MELPFALRQFVRFQFPYMEKPLRPGPVEHIGYVADVRRIAKNIHVTVMALFTTTAPWEPGIPLPIGIIPVEPAMARTMNQKGFIIDARRIAFVPVTTDFFPRLRDADKGIVFTASERFHRHVENTLAKLAKRPELIMQVGPDARGAQRASGNDSAK